MGKSPQGPFCLFFDTVGSFIQFVAFSLLFSVEPSFGRLDEAYCKVSVEMNGLPIHGVVEPFASETTAASMMMHDEPCAMSTDAAQADNLTNSALEHVHSVALQHGYDSMLHDSFSAFYSGP